MSNQEGTGQKIKSNTSCILASKSVDVIVECIKQFLLSVDNEASVKDNGLHNARDNLIKEVQEHFSQLSSISQVCIENSYHVSHSFNVASLSIAIALKIGLKHDDLRLLSLAALAHDIGKLKLPHQILFKGSKRNLKEQELYDLHVPLGYKIAKDELKLNPIICKIILEHHERYNGTGFPRGLSGHDIHPLSLIICVANDFDVLMNKSITPNPMSVPDVVKEMLSNSVLYNPQALHTLVHMVRFSKD